MPSNRPRHPLAARWRSLRLLAVLSLTLLGLVWLAEPATATPLADRAGGPLAANGFASPWCEDPGVVVRLDSTARSNCAASGVAVAPAPIGNYQFDVHIDTGLLGTSSFVPVAIQNILLTPIWTALVWLVHAMLVALEWCYSLDLLGGGALRQIGGALRTAQATFTQPWLVLALALVGVVLIHQGIIRRRVTDSLGDAAMTVTMVVAGLCLIADPAGTVGEVSHTINQASLGTLAAVDAGAPDHPERTFTTALDGVFRMTVTAPWCYLEFGDVSWCADPGRVEPRLRAAAARIATDDRGAAGCNSAAQLLGIVGCGRNGRTASELRTEARLLTAARTNGEFFLALPANSVMRNSINEERSLLRVICETSDATACTGPDAPQAEFRTQSGTWARAGGLLFISIGTTATLLVFGFIGVRLLAAAVMSVVYLLLAPVAVIAPALGERGRSAFRAWAARLLGALVGKLVYSVLLGVLMLMLRILLSLDALGWWTQWLLIAGFWWVVFIHRHQLLGHVFGEDTRRRPPKLRPSLAYDARSGLMQFARRRLRSTGKGLDDTRKPRERDDLDQTGEHKAHGRGGDLEDRFALLDGVRRQEQRNAGEELPRPAVAPVVDLAAVRARDEQVQRVIDAEQREAAAIAAEGSRGGGGGAADSDEATQAHLDDERSRVRLQQEIAAGSDRRRLLALRARLERLDARRDDRRVALATAREALGWGADPAGIKRLRERRGAELDHQASLPRGAGVDGETLPGHRDYAALTALAGVSRSEYQQMSPADKRRVRLDVDRELEQRRQWFEAASAADRRGPRRPPEADNAGTSVAVPAVTAENMFSYDFLISTFDPAPTPIPRSAHERQFTREEFDDLLGWTHVPPRSASLGPETPQPRTASRRAPLRPLADTEGERE